MKIISKDLIEELHTESNPTPASKPTRDVGVTFVTDASRKPSKAQRHAEVEAEKRNQRLQHIDAERKRREAIKRKRREKKETVSKQAPQLDTASQSRSESKSVSRDASERIDRHAKIKAQPRGVDTTSQMSYIGQRIEHFASLIRFNITFKLTLGYAMRLFLLIGLIVIIMYASFSYYLFYQAGENLGDNLNYVSQLMTTADVPEALLEPYLDQNHLLAYRYAEDGTLLYESVRDTAPILNTLEIPTHFDLSNFPDLPMLYDTTTLVIEGSSETLLLSKNLTYARVALETTFPIVIVTAIVLILSSLRAVSKMSNKHLRPIHTMTQEIQAMSLDQRLNVSGTKDELKDLALTFNKMLDDIQMSYEREKQFVSDASHELRTPIAVIKGYAGMLNRWGKDDPAILEESIQAILGETENMHSLVESLLFIARNDKGTLKMDMVQFSLSELVQEIVKETHLIDTAHDIKDQIENNLFQYGSTDKLKQAFRIFVDNSIKYTPEGGNIDIRLEMKHPFNVLTISDNGIGISKEDLPHIFDRFYRADKSRTKLKDTQHGGTGLGLSIAKIIIEQHGGQIVVDSDLNQGTSFMLMLPVSRS